MTSRNARVLILCKTYPSPSAKHTETSCVAGMEANGSLIRLYPVPFRLLDTDMRFKKWQWIDVRVEKSPNDHRPESHKIFVDTVIPVSDPLSTVNKWKARREAISKVPVFTSFASISEAQLSKGTTLAFLKPSSILGLDIVAASQPNWTADEEAKLTRLQNQGSLFGSDGAASEIRSLRKLPFDFYYRYRCESDGKQSEYRHKLVDWEVGALFWKLRRSHGDKWEEPFRKKIEKDLPANDISLLMGTIHRFPDQWLVVSLIYPPRQSDGTPHQGSLF